MRTITMSRTEKGSRTGTTVETFEAGHQYDVPESLALAFEAMGAIDKPRATAAE